MEKYIITREQMEAIKAFMLYRWNRDHNQDDTPNSNSFWANRLDELKICWYVQNQAAYLMTKRENGFKYFSSLLKESGIEIA